MAHQGESQNVAGEPQWDGVDENADSGDDEEEGRFAPATFSTTFLECPFGVQNILADDSDGDGQNFGHGGFLLHDSKCQGIENAVVDDEGNATDDAEADEFAMLDEEGAPLLRHKFEEGLFYFHKSQLTFLCR